jgi:hypothetical protein
MENGISIFSYLTKAGSIRVAIGTINELFIHVKLAQKDEHKTPADSPLQHYFDLEKQAWRSYAPKYLLTIFQH